MEKHFSPYLSQPGRDFAQIFPAVAAVKGGCTDSGAKCEGTVHFSDFNLKSFAPVPQQNYAVFCVSLSHKIPMKYITVSGCRMTTNVK